MTRLPLREQQPSAHTTPAVPLTQTKLKPPPSARAPGAPVRLPLALLLLALPLAHAHAFSFDVSSFRPAWSLYGTVQDQHLGRSAAGVGDVDGDGYDDLVVGAPGLYNHVGSAVDAGDAWLILGSADGPSGHSAWHLRGARNVCQLADGGQVGFSVAAAGDLNGDGLADFVVGAPLGLECGAGFGELTAVGDVYVVYGARFAPGMQDPLEWTETAGVAGAQYGYAVAGAGDVDGDGFDDLLVSAMTLDPEAPNAGAAWLYLGSASGIQTPAVWQITGAASDEQLGATIAGVGDINGDGFDDIAVGAPGYSESGGSEGAAFVWYGGVSGPASDPNVTLLGMSTDDECGTVAHAGDVDADGYADLLVGCPGSSSAAPRGGHVFLYAGGPGGLATTPAWMAEGADGGDALGTSLSGVGDVDGDGYPDVLVGAPGFPGRLERGDGAVALFVGGPGGLSTDPAWTQAGNETLAALGTLVAAAGDVNGDGFADVLAGDPLRDADRGPANQVLRDIGMASLWLGSPTGPLGRADGQVVWEWSGGPTDNAPYIGYNVGYVGDVNGDGNVDIVSSMLDEGVTDGSVLGFLGTGSGFSESPDWIVSGGPGYGSISGAAGDVNGDGYADVLVMDPPQGYVYIFEGSAVGVATTADWSGPGNTMADGGGVGDVNDDGFDDLLLDARSDASQIFYGSASGLAATADAVYVGFDVSGARGAGDVNGDGVDDALCEGSPVLFLLFGDPAGIAATPDWEAAAGDQTIRRFAPIGDVNGDGYQDFAAGDNYYGGYESRGWVGVYLGGAAGPNPEPSVALLGIEDGEYFGSSVSGGDRDGDGRSDLVVGATLEGIASVREYPGRVQVFRGTTGGVEDRPTWTINGDSGRDGFGSDVDGSADIDHDGYADLLIGAVFDRVMEGYGYIGLYAGGPIDTDGDGYATSTDCRDQNDAIHPTATEVCNGRDDDCDGTVDNGVVDAPVWYLDSDSDGWGAPTPAHRACIVPVGYASRPGDCNDADPSINPAASEIRGDGLDQNCNGVDRE